MIWTDVPTLTKVLQTQRATHGVRPIVQVREPEADDNSDDYWHDLLVVEATVTFNDPATLPTRTIEATVLLETAAGEDVLGDDLLSPLGSWIRAYQEITQLTGAKFRVPYGYFRLDSYTVDHLTGSVSFSGTDVSAFLTDMELLTLSEGRITTTQTYLSRLEAALKAATDDLVPVWTDLFDANGRDTTAKPKGAWHVTGSRVEFVQKVANRFGQYLVCPASGSAFVLQDNDGRPDHVTIKGGDVDSTLVGDINDTVDRHDLANVISASYSYEKSLGGGVVQQINRRVVVEYDDTNEEIRTTGPFGRVSRDGLAMDLLKGMTADEAKASVIASAKAALNSSVLKQSRDVSFSGGPYYGLEVGDIVNLVPRIHETVSIKGQLVGLTVPLHADGGPWSYTIRPVKPYDTSWKPRTVYDTTESTDKPEDRADFRTYNPPKGTVAVDDGFPSSASGKGWHITGQHADVPYPPPGKKGKLKIKGVTGGSTLKLIAAGGGADLIAYTDKAWHVRIPTLRRLQLKASVRAVKHAGQVRIGIDYTPGGIVWGKWTKMPARKTRSLAMDVILPSGATDFGIRIQVQNPPAESAWTINSIDVEEAYRVSS